MLITTKSTGTTAAITPHGEISFDALPTLLTAYEALPPSVRQVEWDLRDAVFMDVAGLHLLVHQRLACQNAGRTLTVTGLRHQPLRLLLLARTLFPADCWNDFLPPDHRPATAA
ncbi:STAS domain-containing protein [Streptomyces sp. PLK6-54]|uniref:STAS domain-containing protein n=2 Tax=Actinacidiphila acidipaludis TaxID=2873382 RepID=A0ABS7Q8A6_9ACTN|nr:STAS domain-containing protein [Streptomyces acidipaludis]